MYDVVPAAVVVWLLIVNNSFQARDLNTRLEQHSGAIPYLVSSLINV